MVVGWEVDGICETGGAGWLEMEEGTNPVNRLRSRFPSLDAKEVLCVMAVAGGVCTTCYHNITCSLA